MKCWITIFFLLSTVSLASLADAISSAVRAAEAGAIAERSEAEILFRDSEKAIFSGRNNSDSHYFQAGTTFQGLYTHAEAESTASVRTLIRTQDGTVQKLNFSLPKEVQNPDEVQVWGFPSGTVMVQEETGKLTKLRRFVPFTSGSSTIARQTTLTVSNAKVLGSSTAEIENLDDPIHEALKVRLTLQKPEQIAWILTRGPHGALARFNITGEGRVQGYSIDDKGGVWSDEYVMGKENGKDVLQRQSEDSVRLDIIRVRELGLLETDFKKIAGRKISITPAGNVHIHDAAADLVSQAH